MDELIFELVRDLGQVGGGDEILLRRLIPGAVEELCGQLAPGVQVEDCGSAFSLAAAWMTLAALDAVQEDGLEQMTAGEVSLRRGDRDRGETLRKQARLLMRPYLEDDGFYFVGVRGC